MYDTVLMRRLLAVIRKQQKEIGTELITPAMVVGAALTVSRSDLPAGTPQKIIKDHENLRELLKNRIRMPLAEKVEDMPVRYFRDAVDGLYPLLAREETEDPELCAELPAFNITAEELQQEESITTLVEQLLAARPVLCDADVLKAYISRVKIKKRHRDLPEPQPDLAAVTAEGMKMQTALQEVIFGQNQAIDEFVQGYMQYLLNRGEERKRPQVFLFAGPSGTGKSSLAKAVRDYLDMPFMQFDMTAFSDHNAPNTLIGFSRTYKDSRCGVLTGFVQAHPACILLFDEVEKAHVNVKNLFLQVLEDGVLRDEYFDENVDFSRTILIFTTNAGRSLYETSERQLSLLPKETVVNALRNERTDTGDIAIPSALLSRFSAGRIVVFDHMRADALHMMIARRCDEFARQFRQEHGIEICCDSHLPASLLYASPGADARALAAGTDSFLSEHVMALIRNLAARKENGAAGLKRITFTCDDQEEEARKLFQPKPVKTLFFGFKKRHAEMIAGNVDRADSVEDALKKLAGGMYDMLLCDIRYWHVNKDYKTRKKPLSRIKEDTNGRLLMERVLEEYPSFPVYVAQDSDRQFDAVEKLALQQLGVRGVLDLDAEDFNETFAAIKAGLGVEQQLFRLTRSSSAVHFRAVEYVSASGSEAEIRLCGYNVRIAVQAGDEKSVLNSLSLPEESFADVIGQEHVKQEMKFFIRYLKDPYSFSTKLSGVPKGLLMYGPAGTGKTMLARAFAHEAGLAFISTQGSEFTGPDGAQRLRQTFGTARKYAPAVIFIDEIDQLARKRSGQETYRENALTELLTEMDGFTVHRSRPVFVIGATNYNVSGTGMTIDEAVLRRFDNVLFVDLPDREDRLQALQMEIGRYEGLFDLSDTELESIAVRTAGRSFAWLRLAVNAAVRMLIMKEWPMLDDARFEEAFETFADGEAKPHSESVVLTTARHEAGHALIQWLGGRCPAYITITSRGVYGGYTQMEHDEDQIYLTRKDLLQQIAVAMGGRAAEIVCYGPEAGINTGAAADLQRATRTAEMILTRFGMDEEAGQAVFANVSGASYRTRINQMLAGALDYDIRLIREHRELLDALVEALMKKNHLNQTEMEEIFSGKAVQ